MLIGFVFMLGLVLAACGGGQEASSPSESSSTSSSPSNTESSNEASSGGIGESYHWLFVTEEMEGQLQYEYAAELARRMEEKSDGRITIDVFEFGGLGSEVNQVEQLQNGVVEFAIISPGFTGTMVQEGQVFALHFLFPDDVRLTQDILETSEAINVHLAAKYEEHNIKPLYFWTEGGTQWTGNRELRRPEDFRNFKMRVQESPLMLRSYEAYGANPTSMSWAELYTALDRGVVDGQENPIFFIEDASFHEVQSHMTVSNHNNYVAMTAVNPTFYNNLPADIRQIVDETIEETKSWLFDLQISMNEEMLEKIKTNTDYPTEVIHLTEEERQAFKELAIPVREFFVNEVVGEDGKKILEMLVEEIEAAENR